MPAFSKTFPWPSYYGSFRFFEERMVGHSRGVRFEMDADGVYNIHITDGQVIRVFVCECYSFGVAEFIETKQRLGKIDVIVIDSSWCGYTSDAKRRCRSQKIGLFKIGDFMAALHRQEIWSYLNSEEAKTYSDE